MSTDLDYIKMNYDGSVNDLPNITISETDKSHTDNIFINWSYNGKIIQSETPSSSGYAKFGDVTLSWSELNSAENATTYGYNITNADWTDLSADWTLEEGTQRLGIFAVCTQLTEISLPDSVTSICEYGFYGATSLTTFEATKITSIGTDAFVCMESGGSSLTTISLPDTLITLGELCFAMCPIVSLSLPNSITSISRAAFAYCTSLTTINIPTGLNTISESCFSSCTSIQSITIPANIRTIGNTAFAGCSSLQTVQFEEGTTSIGLQSFINCSAITSITLPNSLTSIGEEAFANCSLLSEIYFGSGLTTIDDYAFNNCPALTKVEISNLANWCAISFYYETSNPIYYAHNVYVDGSLATSLIIPGGVTTINKNVFRKATCIQTLTLPVSITTLNENCFADCSNITSIIYNGTTTQWSAITKVNNWNYNTGAYTVHCTDGDVPKS